METATRRGRIAGLGSWPGRRARISPDRTALADASRSLTYAELADRTARLAGALQRLGVREGDRVAYLGSTPSRCSRPSSRRGCWARSPCL